MKKINSVPCLRELDAIVNEGNLHAQEEVKLAKISTVESPGKRSNEGINSDQIITGDYDAINIY